MAHVFLDAEIVDAEIEMKRGGHADRAHIRGAMAASADVVNLGERSDLAKMGDSPGVYHGDADVVDELLLNEKLTIVDGVEDFAHGDGRCGMAADETETFLHLRRSRILEPEEMIGL